MPSARAAASVLLLLLLPGCSFWKTLDDCADLTATVNPAIQAVRAILERPTGATPDAYRAMARNYAALGMAIAQKRYETVALGPILEQYAILLGEVAQNTEAFARAVESGSAALQQRTQQKARQHVARQRTMTQRIEAVCEGH